jgi:hypothetical protein
MDRIDEILYLYEDDRVEMGDGGITKIKKLQGEFKKDPKLVKLFNKGELYHYRTTIGAGGGPKDKKAYRGTKEELKKIMKQAKSTGKPVVLTTKMKENIKEYEDRTGKKYADLNREKQKRIRDGKQARVGTLPSKEEMKNRISIKQKGRTGGVSAIEDVIFPDPKMKEKFLTELELKYTYVPGKSMPEKYKSSNFAKRYPISERQFERMVSYFVNKKGLKYPKGGEAAQVIAKRRDLQKKVTGIRTESTIVDKIKKPILKQKNLSNKIDLAHRVSMEHMARLGLEYDTRLLGIDSSLINQAIVKPAEFRLSKLYDQQFDVMKKIEKSGLTKELKDQLVDINDQVKKNIKKTSGRLFGITVNPQTLEPSFEGINRKFSLTSKDINVKELDKLPRQERIKLLSPYVSKKVDAEIKRGFRPADFKEILKDKGSRDQILKYVKKFKPDILNKVKSALSNPMSTRRFAIYSKLPAVAIPAGLALNLISDEAQAADGTEAKSILPEVAGGAAAGSLAFKPVRQGIKKGLKATGRVLGKLAVPIGLGAEAYFAKQAYDEGKSIPEIMAAPFFLDSKVRQTQDMLSMKPEERQAINRQMIEDDISGLSSDFETPRKEGVDEVDIVEVLKRVQKKRMADEARRREERAGGGIAGIRRPNAIPPESGPNSQGLENLKYYVTNT